MKQLFKIALLAMAIVLPLDEAAACDRCESTKVWVDAYRDSHGHYHEAHWKIVELCRPPAPPVRPRVIVRVPVVTFHTSRSHHRHVQTRSHPAPTRHHHHRR